MAEDVVFDLLDGDRAGPLADQLRDLYAEVYAEPPYSEGPRHVAQFVRWLAGEVDRAGFSLARATAGGELVGAAYGFTLPAGDWMQPAVGGPPPAEVLDAPKFNVAEWMVRREHRGAGVGGRLLELVLADRPEPWAILASNPAAPARQIYQRRGWRQYGGIAPKTMPPMDVLVRPLH
jgi:GNAT superfamily N-acetyltransferase